MLFCCKNANLPNRTCFTRIPPPPQKKSKGFPSAKAAKTLGKGRKIKKQGNCSEKLVQMSFDILGGFFRVDFPPLKEEGGFLRGWLPVRNSLLERFSGKFRRCWKMIPRFSGSAKCYPCQGLGTFRQGKRLLENWPRLRERCWIFSSETATAFLSSSEFKRVA